MRPPARFFAGLLLPATLWAAEPLPDKVDFNRDIRPILSDHCFKCHGFDPETREAGRRLDTRDGALADSEGLRAIVPGNLKDSDVHWRIHSKEADEIMPPAKGGKPLNEQQIALLDRWIEQGAEYAEHWGFQAPKKVAPPAAAGNAIDAFVGQRLQAAGLQLSPEAERHTLIRRLSLDLVGLPPTPAEVDAFVADAAPGAYERLVERLLASPHYGEKWGRHWLDAARYADTNGYEKDSPRSIWLYRDWVIDAINRDLPYDQFIIEQVAGDLLPGATSAQHVATGFLRNSMLNEEGGVDPEQFRVEQVIDRVETVGRSFLGLTVQCAQCHDHKYDPISQKDYFQIYAFLNNDEEAIYYHPDAAQEKARTEITARVRGIEDELRKADAELATKMAAWEKAALENPQPEWTVLDPVETFGDTGVKFEERADHSLVARGDRQGEGQYFVTVQTSLEKITGFRVELLTDPTLPHSGPGRREENGNCVLTDFAVEIAPASAPKEAPMEKVALGQPTADHEQKDFTVDKALDADPKTGWAIDSGPGQNRSAHAVFPTVEPVGSAEGKRLSFRLSQKFGGQHCIGRFRLLATTSPNPKADPLPADVRKLLAIPVEQRTPEQQQRVFAHYRTTRTDWADANARIAAEFAKWPVGERTLALAERPGGRETHLFKRGDWLQLGDKVEVGGLAILPPVQKSDEPPRLRFARWLASREQPTVARVVVNRVWQQYFGIGLFATAEDLGLQGELPSHPQLLDWLATEFMDRGWSQKTLHRLIVTSATYRQSSVLSPQLAETDPFNRLLARGPRFRVEAEAVRDLALSVSGLLNPRIGGPSVFPVIPDGALSIAFGNTAWKVSEGTERHRRAMYIHWKRSAPFPSLAVFDAPSAEKACTRRNRSNTPLQALTTLNDPAFMECAQGLAMRIYKEAGPDDRARLAHGFRLCTGRSPDEREAEALLALLTKERQAIEEDTSRAITIALADPGKLPPGVNLHKVAAWTLVARVLLNLDETLTKE